MLGGITFGYGTEKPMTEFKPHFQRILEATTRAKQILLKIPELVSTSVEWINPIVHVFTFIYKYFD